MMTNPKNILFVCTANRCRSAFAEAVLKKMLAEEALDIRVQSAGIDAVPGLKPPAPMLQPPNPDALDLSQHQSRKITGDMIEDADLIFVMEGGHRQAIVKKWPAAGIKVFLLSDFYSGTGCFSLEYGIPDPIGMGDFFYENVKEIIRDCCQEIFNKLLNFRGKKRPFPAWRQSPAEWLEQCFQAHPAS